jgi:hypothetical protein
VNLPRIAAWLGLKVVFFLSEYKAEAIQLKVS